ncbi:MAG: metal-sensitive transcriptional regulator [Actinomycetia bacterium]|nr:metal-sensitive transcriptional regulator [Actinomycetes bacterium]
MKILKTPKTKSEKTRIIHRLKIARGHLSKLIEMVENDDYCIDLITQSLAVRKAVKSTENIILERHLRTCFKNAMAKGSSKDQDKMIKEILDLEDYHDR